MGNCDSITNRSKKLTRIISSEDLNGRSTFYSSPTLPKVSSYFNRDIPTSSNQKKNYSVGKTNPHEDNHYILPIELAKREDVTKKYKFSKQVLGDGATSLVYLAENSAKEKFAIKRINKEKNSINQKVMLKEAELCLKLNHKNIIKYYEIYEDSKYINIVMEQGQTIRSPLGYFPDEIAIDFLIQIFSAIDYIHSMNIVHCDIKPENFVLKIEKGKAELKLVDFGNAIRKPKQKERLFNFKGKKDYLISKGLKNIWLLKFWKIAALMKRLMNGQLESSCIIC